MYRQYRLSAHALEVLHLTLSILPRLHLKRISQMAAVERTVHGMESQSHALALELDAGILLLCGFSSPS